MSETAQIFEFWNEQKITIHKELTSPIQDLIKRALTEFSASELKSAIRNYGLILTDDNYFFSYKWNLTDFLQRGLSKQGKENNKGFRMFLSVNDPLIKFSRNGNNNKLSLTNWHPVTKEPLLYKDGLYEGYSFATVKQNVWQIKEWVDYYYIKFPSHRKPAHFEWLEELLATCKYQRSNLPNNINIAAYLLFWQEEKDKSEVKEFINNEL